MSLRLEGVDVVIANLQALAARVPERVGQALYEEAGGISTVSQTRTPVDTGALRASHRVSQPETNGTEISVEISVGGAAADYAVYVHERLDTHHDVGQAKFLESALVEAEPQVAARIAERLGALS